jgi:predicted dehydrogenase
MKLTMGFIGFGKSVTRYHLPYLLVRDHVKVKKIYSRTKKEEIENTYKTHGIEFTYELNELLNDAEIQLISICTAHNSHYELAKKCLEHNKHVLVEKPFVTTTEEAKELLSLAKERDLVIMPYQNRRFDSDFLALKEVLEKGYLGEVVEVESHMDYYRTEAPTSPGEFYDGAFYGLGVHTLDQIVSLFGKPDKLYYDIRSVRNPKNPDDYYHVELFYPTLKVIVKTNHLVKVPYPRFIVHGTKGSFIKYGIDRQEEFLKAGMMPGSTGFGEDREEHYGVVTYTDEQGQEVQREIPSPTGDYGRVYDSLYDHIINGKQKLVSDEEVLLLMQILENGVKGDNPEVLAFN